MTARMIVKVCGIQESNNAREISECVPDYMGFILVPESPRYVQPHMQKVVLQSVPATTRTVGVFRNAPLEDIENASRSLSLSAVQLHGDEDADYIAMCRSRIPSCHIFKAVSLSDNASVLKHLPKGVDLYIFDGSEPGSGKEFDWQMLEEYRGTVPFLLAGGIGPDNLDRVKFFMSKHPLSIGIDVNSKVELRVGLKDSAAVRRVVQGVRG